MLSTTKFNEERNSYKTKDRVDCWRNIIFKNVHKKIKLNECFSVKFYWVAKQL